MTLLEHLLVHARLADGREQNKVLPARHLHVDVFVVVPVQGRGGGRRADPQVDGFRAAVQRHAGPGDVALDVGEEGRVLVSEVVVLRLGVEHLFGASGR